MNAKKCLQEGQQSLWSSGFITLAKNVPLMTSQQYVHDNWCHDNLTPTTDSQLFKMYIKILSL